MINPHKMKYHDLYWEIARAAARQSISTRHQVGAVVVTTTGMLSIGWNGMPSGLRNECEDRWVTEKNGRRRRKTDPRVIHAEQNALDKMLRQGISTEGAIIFITRAPCFECAKSMCSLGLKTVYFDEFHDCQRGLDILDDMNIPWLALSSREAMEAP
mgnify:CR=1 FL=1